MQIKITFSPANVYGATPQETVMLIAKESIIGNEFTIKFGREKDPLKHDSSQ